MRFCNGYYRVEYSHDKEYKRSCNDMTGCGGINCPVNKHYGMRMLMEDVALFHNHVDAPVKVDPEQPSPERARLRGKLIQEEYEETLKGIFDTEGGVGDITDAPVKVDLVKVADGLADLIYVCIGTALEFGIPLDKVWDEVQRSNMEKVRGGVKRREDGKILKPDDWTPPNLKAILEGE